MDTYGKLQAVAETMATGGAALIADRIEDAGAVCTWPGYVLAQTMAGDPLPYLDLLVERLVVRGLGELCPADDVLAREYGRGADARPQHVRWVVEPISGAVNLLGGQPTYAVSVAAQIDAVTVAGAVAESGSGWVWSAARGGGAVLRQPHHAPSTLYVDGTEGLEHARVATGFHADRSIRIRQGQVAGRLIGQVRDLRIAGSPALQLCWVAAGFIQGYYEHGVDVAGWAAGALIAEEAGAVVHWPGGPGVGTAIGDPILASDPDLAEELALALKHAGAELIV
jgi:myo-inositol-1(or 4)-monophosphatase